MRVSTVVDTDSLAPEERTKLQDLVRSANLSAKKPGGSPSPGRPDQFSYRLTVAENDQAHVIYVQEPDVPAELRPLLDWLMARARRRQRPD